MQANVTEQGVTIPKLWLEGIDKVEILKEGDRVILIPVVTDKPDPIWGLGTQPVEDDISDASENLDLHIYGPI